MRAISSFNREAGTSTFWCRAWSAFRTRVSISATGSVSLILASPPAARSLHVCGEPAAACYFNLALLSSCCSQGLVILSGAVYRLGSIRFSHRSETRVSLPGRLRNSRNLPAQCQLPEAKPADPELPQEAPRTPAELAAVMLARGKLGLPRLLLVQPNSVFN